VLGLRDAVGAVVVVVVGAAVGGTVTGRGAPVVALAVGVVVAFVAGAAATAGAVEGGSCCACRCTRRLEKTAVAVVALSVMTMMRPSTPTLFISNCASAGVERRSSEEAQTKRRRCTVPMPRRRRVLDIDPDLPPRSRRRPCRVHLLLLGGDSLRLSESGVSGRNSWQASCESPSSTSIASFLLPVQPPIPSEVQFTIVVVVLTVVGLLWLGSRH
jgi:hypothetical protein